MNIALVVDKDGYISAFSYADGRDMHIGAISVVKEKCLSPLVDHDNLGTQLPEETVRLREFRHVDGNTYLIGMRAGNTQDFDYAAVINFAKGDNSLPLRWL